MKRAKAKYTKADDPLVETLIEMANLAEREGFCGDMTGNKYRTSFCLRHRAQGLDGCKLHGRAADESPGFMERQGR